MLRSLGVSTRITLTALVLVALGGCASTQLRVPEDFPRMTVDPKDESTLVFAKPGLQLGRYRRVYLDPVRMLVRENGKEAAITSDEATQIAAHMQSAFRTALGKEFEIAPAPGSDVLRIRLSVTDIKPTNAAQVAMMVPPFAMVNLVSPEGAFMGSITLAGEFFEENQTQPSAAFVAYRSRPGADATVAFSRWAAAKKVIDNAAQRLARDLAALRG